MSTVVIGIDPSLSSTGVCRVVDGKEQATITVPTSPEQTWPARLIAIRSAVRSFIARGVRWEDTLIVAMESQIFLSPNLYADAAAVHGVLQTAIWEIFEPRKGRVDSAPGRFLSINPQHVKKWLGAKEKDEVLLRVYKLYKREFRDHNQADAYTLAMIGDSFLAYTVDSFGKLWPDATKPQIEVLDKLRLSGLPWEQKAKPKRRKKEKVK